MTIEQYLQSALQAAIRANLVASGKIATVIAEKTHDGAFNEPQDEAYPCIVIITSTPVPEGNKSYILSVPCWIRVMSYLPDARTKQQYAELTETIFTTIQTVEDWTEFEEENSRVVIGDVTIDAGEEPVVEGRGLMIQETRCTIHACYTPIEES